MHRTLEDLRTYRPEPGVPWALLDATIIDGTGGPAFGPAHVVILDGRISRVLARHDALAGLADGDYSARYPDEVAPEHRFSLEGMHLLPGFIDAHAHIGAPDQVESTDYVFKLWLGHGITRVREVGSLGIGFGRMAEAARRSAAGELAAPIIHPYLTFGREDVAPPPRTGDEARAWVRAAREHGALGVKFFGAAPELMRAALAECRALDMGSACHHSQQTSPRANALQTARWGLGSIEHSYGQAEAMYADRVLPAVPAEFNYSDEAMRFREAGSLWVQGARPSDSQWGDFLDELVGLGTTLVPTFAVYNAARDAERARNREWVREYVSPRLARFFTPCAHRHGSFFADWTTEDEVLWKEQYRIWMRFVRDFALRGGRVCAGSDPGFIHSHYGFSFVDELELLREAGFQPLEVIRAATLHAAELLGIDGETGSIEAGKSADLVLVGENPLRNLKTLSGVGHYSMDEGGAVVRRGGVEIAVVAGRVVDARRALREAREFVAACAEA
ncbi:amidohydrolase family protein [Gulosibacter sp. 10]|uniref:amidohydrolase family protein n=1 Tax=Gulosibacter sp. 10 TaxID=1255570 RepID=UPI00097EFF02|nr:amidohydrolase family protein [Gulosibacter sp. 10]SJM63874.1 Amidohydrolase family enzyme [Gulosibacter sp. 10]